MSQILQFIIGVQTKISFTVMPEELLALPNLQAPVDVPIVVGSAIAPLDAALTVTALPGPIPAGTPISLTTGTGATLRTLTVFTAAHAGTNATTILIEPVSALQIQKAMKDPAATAFPTGAVGTYIAKLRLQGGTTSQKDIQNQNTATKVYQDGLAFETGIITSASWKLSYSYNVLPLDPGYYRLNYATTNAIAGIHGYAWFEDPAPVGYTKGNSIEGLVQIENINQTNPADGIVTGQSSIMGRGVPLFKPYA